MPKLNLNESDKSWVFTCNNYTDSTIDQIARYAENARYCVYGKEVGANGTPHLQGYITFKSERKRKSLMKHIKPIWCEPAKGNAAQNTKYTTKDENATFFGKIPVQGARNDIHSFVLTVQQTPDRIQEENLLLDHSSLVARYPRFVDRVQRHFHPPTKLTALNNSWYYGPPGTGKTVTAQELGTYYMKSSDKWFDGYASEDVIIVEDLEPKHAYFMSWFLKIWGDYSPFTAQVKGSSTLIRPKIICVTSNYSIDEMGFDEITTKAIKRRFKEKLFNTQYEYPKD